MARLYDRVMIRGLQEFHDAPGHETELWRKAMRAAHVVDGEAVAQYFFDSVGWADGDWGPADFPNPRPPFDVTWTETFMRRKDGGRVNIGTLFLTTGGDEGAPPEEVTALVVTELSKRDLRLSGYPISGPRHAFVAECMWPISNPTEMRVRSLVRDIDVADGTYQEEVAFRMARVAVGPAILTLALMNCRNVERREVEQPPKLSKKWAKKHGRPLVRYHVLDIDPMRKVLRDEGGSEKTGLKKALHICRGHFATYTDDAPLFGRVTGTFWKPQHVRGSAKHGVVVKDYNVKAPNP
jgi:hypothetical protein